MDYSSATGTGSLAATGLTISIVTGLWQIVRCTPHAAGIESRATGTWTRARP